MRSCKTCGKRMKWSSFGTEVCSDCTKHWEGFFAEENALCEGSTPASTAPVEPELEDLDLDRLLASVRFNEREDAEVFSQIWVPGGYPARLCGHFCVASCRNNCSPVWTVGHFVPTAVVFHSSRAGKKLPDHLLQAFRSPSQNQIDQRWTERSRRDGKEASSHRREAPRIIQGKPFNRLHRSRTILPRPLFSPARRMCKSSVT